ncbi:hypothetical protein RhiJN_27820 [Ceratobasidium sp. AG-Ba]|nr:hypothetical protein RhiJN_27820 [Ceratobasidium sp. AG-Ba]
MGGATALDDERRPSLGLTSPSPNTLPPPPASRTPLEISRPLTASPPPTPAIQPTLHAELLAPSSPHTLQLPPTNHQLAHPRLEHLARLQLTRISI